MTDIEPEPQYAWDMSSMRNYNFAFIDDQHFYRRDDMLIFTHFDFTDEQLLAWGCVKSETAESRLARAEWRIRQLELELERRQD